MDAITVSNARPFLFDPLLPRLFLRVMVFLDLATPGKRQFGLLRPGKSRRFQTVKDPIRCPVQPIADMPGQLASNFHDLGCPGLGLVAARTFIYGEGDIPDVLGRRARKTLAVCVLPDGLIDVIAPEQVSCERSEDRPASTDAMDPKVGAGKPAQNFAQLTQQAAHCCQVIIKYYFSFHMAAVCALRFELSVFE
ncbi:hypothetical protein [Rhodovulum sulfidophilum]|uniref:hypothetical protein n=1 Tax=Rhodovulum sulfidophilum TaxID=35806 RepID=UPI00117B339A|nr:hypothetical protein [Rhodovulum sulfidophilum]MBL3551488.1 hypothetical protein [Rhodovulum sulfidophilum]